MTATTSDWKAIGARKKQSVLNKIPQEWRLPAETLAKAHEDAELDVTGIPRECGILTADEITITEKYDATDLLAKLAAGEYSSLAVTTAFCKRAAIANQLTNCLTETFFDEAIERANYLDEHLAKEKKPFGPLHGLPISIKDSFNYIGQETTLGFVSFVGGKTVAKEHSALVKMLLDLGAVLYIKSNIPQTLMTADSENHVFGRTLNPHKLTLTAGGSSGGEGAVVGMRAAVLGVGTDIGGSIRVPALCCGTYGYRPSASRIPYGGQGTPGRVGSPGVLAVAGPLTTSFRDVRLFMEVVLGQQPWKYDHAVLHAPWRQLSAPKTLTIGTLPIDPAFPIHPPMRRALDSAISKLKAAGHTIVPLGYVPSIAVANREIADYYSLDPAITPFKNIEASGEPKIRSVAESPFVSKRNGKLDMDDLYTLNATRAQCMAAWHKIWTTTGIDVILGPVCETTAMPHDTFGNTPYTTLYNYLDYPSIVIPHLKADKEIDVGDDFISYKGYNAEKTHGAPTGVQVAARPQFDEELLNAAEIISEVLKA
ncbi:hypothetical protein SBRCBS47491_009568 [Sporothrix bragantina]|uniref:amidase n=1 Tax=Sporothrix bragantina TaxID=671064 RepID=A0ABP0CVS9_9PEZI